MGSRRGRRPRLSHVTVRTERREEIDVDALVRAVLEQAAMEERAQHVRRTVSAARGEEDTQEGGS